MIIDLDPEDTTVADSEPERKLLAYRAGSAAFSDGDDGRTVYPVASTSRSVSPVPSLKKQIYRNAATADHDSDIEILDRPGTAPSRVMSSASTLLASKQAARKKRSVNAGAGFKSAAALLKSEARDQARRSASSSSGDERHSARAIVDIDIDDSLELPPPLTRPLHTANLLAPPMAQQKRASSTASTSDDEPEILFRNKLDRFRSTSSESLAIKSEPRTKAPVQRSLFAPSADSTTKSDSSKPTSRRFRSTLASTVKPDTAITIPTPYLALITTCPSCSAAWTTSKTAATKLTHIKKCALKEGMQQDTVMELVERQVRSMQDSIDEERRKAYNNRTMFEAVVSRRGKDVTVVGVERKTSTSSVGSNGKSPRSANNPSRNASDEENKNPLYLDTVNAAAKGKTKAPVLLTQGGTGLSQATKSQVQRELDGRIKIAQKVNRGDYVASVLQPRQAGRADANESDKTGLKLLTISAANGVGSKNWKKAEELLAKSAMQKAEQQQKSRVVSILDSDEEEDRASRSKVFCRTGKLESYATARFRLAERAKEICAMRGVPMPPTSPSFAITAGHSLRASPMRSTLRGSTGDVRPDTSFDRSYRRTDRLTRSYIDAAEYNARQLDYDSIALAGSVIDSVPHRNVSSSSSPLAFDHIMLAYTPIAATVTSAVGRAASSVSPLRVGMAMLSTSTTAASSSHTYASTSSAISRNGDNSSSGLRQIPTASLAAQTAASRSSTTTNAIDNLQALTQRLQSSSTSSRVTEALKKAREEKARAEGVRGGTSALAASSPSKPLLSGRTMSSLRISSDEEADVKPLRLSLAKKEEDLDDSEISILFNDLQPAKYSDDEALAEIGSSVKPRDRTPKIKATSESPKRKRAPSSTAKAKKPGKAPLAVGTLDASGTVQATATAAQADSRAKPAKKPRAKTASPRNKGKSRADGATAATATADVMPEYENWDKDSLQAETGKYGYKPSGSKKVLVAQLVQLWRALHPDAAAAADEADSDASQSSSAPSPQKKTRKAPALAPWKRKPKAAATEREATSAAASDAEAAPVKAKKPAKPRKKKVPLADAVSDAESEEEVKSAGERLREEVFKDKPLYMRLLRYEPICFTDFEDIASRAGIKISKVALRDWLDSQSIIFYYPQDTGRNASRQKKPPPRRP